MGIEALWGRGLTTEALVLRRISLLDLLFRTLYPIPFDSRSGGLEAKGMGLPSCIKLNLNL